MMRAMIFGVLLAVPLLACAKSPPKSSSSTGGTTSSGGTSNGGSTSTTGGAPGTGGVCDVTIPSEAGAGCYVDTPIDAGAPLDAGAASNLGKVGPYTVGHVDYILSDTTLYARPIAVGVWYPADPGAITPGTPPAQYPLDEWSDKLPVSTSTDWEALGYDPAYEAPPPSVSGPFPLVVHLPGLGAPNWPYIYLGTRLASHGFVVAIADQYRDGQYPWSGSDDFSISNRILDVLFAITELLQKNVTVGELLCGVMDPSKVAVSGHSIGGYTTLALAGGGDEACQAAPAADGGSACATLLPDPRIKAIIPMDPSCCMRFDEMATISVPSLILGESVEHVLSYNPGQSADDARGNARTHAAINRGDSYRVDLTMANHGSFTNYCDGPKVMASLGVDASTMASIFGSNLNSSSSYPCGTYGGFDPTTNSATHQIVTTYMLALLNTYFGRDDDSWMLTSSYARQNQPSVELFETEACNECLVGDGEYSYRPHPCECSVAKKGP